MSDYETFNVNGREIITEDAWMAEFRRRLLYLKKRKGLSYKALGDLALLSPNTIHNWTRRRNAPRVIMVYQIAAALECSPAYLLCLTDEIDG